MAEQTSSDQKKILVIEDDGSILSILSGALGKEGYSIISAHNGEEGLEIAKKEQPNLIFLDVLMPKMDGLAMLKSLREDEWGKAVPVIVLTNSNQSEQAITDLNDPNVEFFIKADTGLNEVVDRARAKLGE